MDTNWLSASKSRHGSLPGFLGISSFHRGYSSDTGMKPDASQSTVSSVPSTESSEVGTAGGGGSWMEILENARKSTVDATTDAGKKVKELTDAVTPHVQQLFDTYPNLEKVVVPLGGTLCGVATAFAARDVLGNILSGFSLQFSKPFSVNDYIKAGPIEGKVVEIGLTSTSLINPEKLPVIVPNSLFSSQMIVNRSRANWRASVAKIPIRIEDIEKVPSVSEEIKVMLRSNPNVSFDSDVPYCYLSRLESSYGELTIGCNLKNMRKDERLSAEQDILLGAARIIKSHGIELGSTMQCF
ncbi:hypothetical protein HU200_012005 [Digitaria exilis]|uniref:Mechanosensitive ion channel MscS domain-containing protein n=1 Tax=Digitaria exilis TaxID=1010633 RepID=A0A835FFE4_9POAL|nr:hypothetical protein HU200_012005 [Digitaria exilis]